MGTCICNVLNKIKMKVLVMRNNVQTEIEETELKPGEQVIDKGNTSNVPTLAAVFQTVSTRDLIDYKFKQEQQTPTLTRAVKEFLSLDDLNGLEDLPDEIRNAEVFLYARLGGEIPMYAGNSYDENYVPTNSTDKTSAEWKEDDLQKRAKQAIIARYGSVENFKAGKQPFKQITYKFNCPYLDANFILNPTNSEYDIIESYLTGGDKVVEVQGSIKLQKRSGIDNYASFQPTKA